MIVEYVVAAILLVFIIWFYRMLMNPALQYHTVRYKTKAALFFWLGDIRWVGWPGMVSWSNHQHQMTPADVRQADIVCQAGDIGVHRDDGFLSNVGIPGCFKHAWFVSEDNQCVEAMSEGVICRDRMGPLMSDYAIILRPQGVSLDDINMAIKRANSIVGCEYDANFRFDFATDDKEWTSNLSSGNFHGAFSCTETVGFTWYHKRDALDIFRTMHAGREAIVADDFLRMNFDVVYASPNVTVEWAELAGMHEEGRVKIANYWANKKV